MTVKLEKGDAAQCFFSLPEQKERVGSGNHKPGQLLIVTYQRTDSIFSSRNQEIFFSDPFQWSLFKAMKYYPTLHTLMWQRKQRVANISFYPFPRRGGGGDGNILTPQVIYGKSNQGEREGKYSILLK